jgi:hypothetical protein
VREAGQPGEHGQQVVVTAGRLGPGHELVEPRPLRRQLGQPPHQKPLSGRRGAGVDDGDPHRHHLRSLESRLVSGRQPRRQGDDEDLVGAGVAGRPDRLDELPRAR